MKNLSKKTIIIIGICVVLAIALLILLLSNKDDKSEKMRLNCTGTYEEMDVTFKVYEKGSNKTCYITMERYVGDYTEDQMAVFNILVENIANNYKEINGLTFDSSIVDNKAIFTFKIDEENVNSDVVFNDMFGNLSLDIENLKEGLESGGFKCEKH